jgi:hypothetical protein
MKELFRTNDPTVISFVEVVLSEKGIELFVFDTNASVLDGSIGILPRRMMVINDDHLAAKRAITLAGLEHELKT